MDVISNNNMDIIPDVTTVPVAETDANTDESIPRLYHYNNDNVLVFNDNFGNDESFAEQLNRVHGFIDCIHDQFDPQRKNIFFSTEKGKEKDKQLKELIWNYFIGTNSANSFKTNGDAEYKYDTGIHTLAHALEIEDGAPNTQMTIKIGSNIVNNNKDIMYFNCVKWEDPQYDKLKPATVYKFNNYVPNNSKDAGKFLRTKYSEPDMNKHFILDCGSKSFHEGFVNNSNNPSISFFSGILDSSTTNDPVPIEKIEDENIKKLQFEIPYLYLPGGGRIDVHCKFKTDDKKSKNIDPTTLEITFKANDQTYGPIDVTKYEVPSLPDVSEFISEKLGCLNAIKRMAIGRNPCKYYVEKLPELLNNDTELTKMFMIAFKHMGDKIRLIDAVIANNILTGKCHTATIDTFSNRYAILGNLHTIMPIKTGKYVYVNNCHNISQEDREKIKAQNEERDKLLKDGQKTQFEMLFEDNRGDNLKNVAHIINLFCKDDGIFQKFKENVKLKKCAMMRRCLRNQYWEVSLDNNNIHKNFLNITYDIDDNAKINTCYNILYNLKDVNIDEYKNKLNVYFNNNNLTPLDNEHQKKLNILLDLDRMYTKLSVYGVNVSNDAETITSSKKIDLKQFADIISKCKLDVTITDGQSGGSNTTTLWNIDEDIDQIYYKNLENDLNLFGVMITNNNDTEVKKEGKKRKEREDEYKSESIEEGCGNVKSDLFDKAYNYIKNANFRNEDYKEHMEYINGDYTISIGNKRNKNGQSGGDNKKDAILVIDFLKHQHEAHEMYTTLYNKYNDYELNEHNFEDDEKAVQKYFEEVDKYAYNLEEYFIKKTETTKVASAPQYQQNKQQKKNPAKTRYYIENQIISRDKIDKIIKKSIKKSGKIPPIQIIDNDGNINTLLIKVSKSANSNGTRKNKINSFKNKINSFKNKPFYAARSNKRGQIMKKRGGRKTKKKTFRKRITRKKRKNKRRRTIKK